MNLLIWVTIMDIIIKETSLEESLKVFCKIPEWDRPEAGEVDFCEKQINGRKSLVLSAYVNDHNVGYLIAYEKNNTFYCWVAAIDPNYRRIGILTKMMNIYEDYAKNNHYKKLTLKTINNKRAMLCYLVKNHWKFVEVIKKDNIDLNEILVEKEI